MSHLLSEGERGGGAVHLQRLRTPPARVEERRQRRARGLRHRGRRGGHVSAAELLLRILWFAEWERHVVVANLHNLRQGAEEGGLQRAPLPRRRQSVPEGDALAVHLKQNNKPRVKARLQEKSRGEARVRAPPSNPHAAWLGDQYEGRKNPPRSRAPSRVWCNRIHRRRRSVFEPGCSCRSPSPSPSSRVLQMDTRDRGATASNRPFCPGHSLCVIRSEPRRPAPRLVTTLLQRR